MKIHYNVTGADRKALVKVIADTAGARAVYKNEKRDALRAAKQMEVTDDADAE